MHPSPKLLLLLHAVLLAASPHGLQAQRPAPAAAACTPQERDALLAFKQSITISSDTAGLLASWRREDDDCCRWRGVRCSNRTGHVVALNLRGHELAGEISPSLLSLPHLEHLDLSSNSLVGPAGSIPGFLGSLGNLRYLNLSGMPFAGEVPPHLGNLSKLHYLDLSSYANVHSEDLSWLTRLPFLRFLSLVFVDLSTVHDWAHVVNALPLRSLHLEGCSLTSANQSLPHSNLTTTLEVLNLAVNKFDQQPVASCWLWNLTRLKQLYLDYNHGLYGPLPDALGGMVSLQELSFKASSNMMSMASADLKNLCNLRFLYLDNCFSNGFEAERLPQCASSKLQELHLMGNQLTGPLANWMGHHTSLVILDLSVNNITGPIPKLIGQFRI